MKQLSPSQQDTVAIGPTLAVQHWVPARCQWLNLISLLHRILLEPQLGDGAAVGADVVVVLVQPPSLTSPQGQEPHTVPAPHLRSEAD